MNLVVAANDNRAIQVLASGLPLFFGAQLAVDITVRCTLAADGTAQPGAARVDGAVCTRAREDKERTYSELLRGDRCRLVVVTLETGGRWSEEALQFVESLASDLALTQLCLHTCFGESLLQTSSCTIAASTLTTRACAAFNCSSGLRFGLGTAGLCTGGHRSLD